MERRHANPDHIKILRQGVRVWNEWRRKNPLIRPHITSLNHPWGSRFELKDWREIDLSNADLAGSSFEEADFRGSNFEGADLTVVALKKCNFANANLLGVFIGGTFEPTSFELRHGSRFEDVNLSGAYLEGAQLSPVDFADVNLKGANLLRARIVNSEFKHTDFSQSIFGGNVIANTDFGSAIGLEDTIHRIPSTIGIDTVYRSGGQIPESFLRGCGVPDIFIKYIQSLTAEAIQYYSCFISHSSGDKDFSKRLHADLQDNGVRCWIASEDMQTGDKIRPTLDESIRVHDKLLIVLSNHSITSQWVEKEVETAFEEENRRKRTVLFPIRLDDTVMETNEAWAADIRRMRHIGDFSGWKNHDKYRNAFDRLLHDLKAAD